jgi:virginiamycin B lyase
MSLHDQVLSVTGRTLLFAGIALAPLAFSQTPASPPVPPVGQAPVRVRPPRIVRPGVATEGVSRSMSDIQTEAVLQVEGSPDWAVVTKDSVWITSARANHVVQLLAAINKVGLIVDVQRPCSGLADGFGSIWIPSCGGHSVIRVDPTTGKTVAEIAGDPANSEGGITVGAGSVWMVTKPSALVRIDPKTNAVVATIQLPSGSENPLFSDGFLWVSSFEHDQLLKVDPVSEKIVATIPVGPKPRFLTAGAGSVWTLNQGDGTISRVEMKTGKVVATISCGIPGSGGEITFGAGSVWATMFDFPLTQVDPRTNKVTKQWGGPGGDGIRFGFGSVWLSNGRQGTVWRISPDQK